MKKLICVLLIVFLFTSCTKEASLTVFAPSNRAYGWGMKRGENGPEFTQNQIETMEKYDCIYRGNPNEKVLYLTFDEGYENGYTSVILDTLREKGVPAAFFVTSAYVKNAPELVVRMSREGHIIGNHTANHPSLPTVSEEEIQNELKELDRLVYNLTKKNCTYFRPPKGEYSEKTLDIVNKLGYRNTFWSFAYVDWDDEADSSIAKEKILNGFHNGEVLLLHATAKANADCLGEIIDIARQKGYTFKILDEYKS